MKRVADTLTAWLTLRTLVAVLGLSLLLSPSNPTYFNWLDQALFGFGVQLHKAPEPRLGVSLVELPEEETAFLTREPGKAEKTFQLLSRITASDKVVVGLLLPKALPRPMAADQLLSSLLADGESLSAALPEQQRNAIESYLNVSGGLHQFAQHPRVLMARSPASPHSPSIQPQPSAGSEYARWFLPWLRPALPEADSSHSPERALSLLWQAEEGPRAGFVLDVYSRLSRAETVTWKEYAGLQIGAAYFPLSFDGSLRPYPHGETTERLSLDEALENRLSNNLILLGPANSRHLAGVANALRSLDNNSYYRTPIWFATAQAILLLLVVFHLVVIIPRLSYSAGVLASCLLAVILVVAQLGWQITQWQWLPMGVPVQFLLLGHLLILLWKRQNEHFTEWKAAAHGARYQLGLQLFRDGRADDALLAIKECFTTEAVLGLMYDIAAQQERKRHYGEALKTYRTITDRRQNFRDAAQKVEKLMAFSSGAATSITGESEITKTLIISESSINKPVLGRYEVERELGRGAMGVVYLGRDPKIARHVAIKTLSYGQLDPDELEEFKQRFFREAEAAGRLSHPNIVTIYDVGEEHDLAFIAMDYVKGSPLNAFVHSDSRLPLREVLRITAEAADALEYAHGKKVVHRDIKPANIMYSPETGHIKVTDFGVARIVDSAKTNTGDVLGSPLYMSPEQLKGARVEHYTDIYSLGVTLFQLLSGELPFTGENLANLTYNILNNKTPNIRQIRSDLPPGITRIVNRALQKDPAKRFPNAAAMAEALRKLAAEL